MSFNHFNTHLATCDCMGIIRVYKYEKKLYFKESKFYAYFFKILLILGTKD